MTLDSNSFDHVFKFGPLSLTVHFFDIYARVEGHYTPDEYHEVERGHWANGYMPGTGELVLEEGTVDVDEAFIQVPLLTRLLGSHLADDICERLNERFADRIDAFITDVLEDDLNGFDWSE